MGYKARKLIGGGGANVNSQVKSPVAMANVALLNALQQDWQDLEYKPRTKY